MTWLDWVIVAMAIWFVLQGMLKGGTAAILGALAIIVSYVGAAILLPTIGERPAEWLSKLRLTEMTPVEAASWGRTAGFVLTFIVAYIVLLILINFLPGAKRPSMLAQVVGIFTGLMKALVAAMAVVGVLLASPFSSAMAADVQQSSLARFVAEFQRDSIQRLSRGSPIPFPPVGPDHKF